jgi:uncharacterized protein
MKIGVISDTHGYLDPKVFDLFSGVDHILHAGDIGFASIILELEEIAPVTAVNGNTDMDLPFKETEVIKLGDRKFLVHHIGHPQQLSERATARIGRERPDAVVFGHTHRRFNEIRGDRLFFNPGYSGKPKHGVDRSVAVLHCDNGTIRPEFLAL